MAAKHPDICTCPANSPFLWSTRYVPGSSFAADWSKNAASAKASTDYVDSQRAAGHDVGHIHGLTDKVPPHRHRPGQFVVNKGKGAKERAAEVLKPARNAITIAPRGDHERARKKRMASI
jgi:hypothetical protein